MVGKPSLTMTKIFEKQKYLNIIHLIGYMDGMCKNTQFLHLRFALCKNHGLNMDNNPHIRDYYKHVVRIKDTLPWVKEEGRSKQSAYNLAKGISKSLSKSVIEHLEELNPNYEDSMFNDFQGLRKALVRLKDLKLILTEKIDGKGHNKYHLTPKGHYLWLKWLIKHEIDNAFPVDRALPNIYEYGDSKLKKDMRNFYMRVLAELFKIDL